MPKAIKLSDEVVKQLDKLRHIGQSYDGVLRELLKMKSSVNVGQDTGTSPKN